MRLSFLLYDLAIGIGGRDGKPPRQQEIACVARSDLDHVAARAKIFDVFPKNDFHRNVSSTPAPRRAEARCCATSVWRQQGGAGAARKHRKCGVAQSCPAPRRRTTAI